MSEAFQSLLAQFGPDALQTILFNWTPKVLGAVVAVVVTLALMWLSNRALSTIFKRTKLDRTAAVFVLTVVRFALITIGLLTALAQLGIDTTSILASLGVLGLTLGFAAQNTLSNVISGLFIFWDRPFVIGDMVDADGEYGRVDTITLRSTRLITVDGRMVSIPNTVMANQKVASYTNFPNLRLDIPITIGVNESIERARALLLAIVDSDPRYMPEPVPMVHVAELGDYNVTIKLKVWIHDETTHIAMRSELREKAKAVLDAAGVEMPFETLAIAPVTVLKTA